jgi:hypothetical protein
MVKLLLPGYDRFFALCMFVLPTAGGSVGPQKAPDYPRIFFIAHNGQEMRKFSCKKRNLSFN